MRRVRRLALSFSIEIHCLRSASDIIAEVTANNSAILYRCRWNRDEASRVIPELIQVLSDEDPAFADKALRALFTVGTAAVAAAPRVAQLIDNERPITRQLATLTIGQIAHESPCVCAGAVTLALRHKECRDAALRILKFLGSAAKSALPEVLPLCECSDAGTRKQAILAVISMDRQSPDAQRIIAKGRADPSKAVREAVEKAAQPS
jgi:vesicle coat complex subunit